MTQVSRRLIAVVETPVFLRQAQDVWEDTDREAFVDFIAWNPEVGDVIPETGGVRKVRWSRSGTGKRGGARVIYFYHNTNRPVYLLMVYAKSRRDDLTPDEKKMLRRFAAVIKSERG
jgi:mRNA-degrading endonuclease RelE of RelBE toxin-antitoxin system